MLGTEFLRKNGFISYENGGFRKMGEKQKQIMEKARAKSVNEILEQRIREEKMSYRGR